MLGPSALRERSTSGALCAAISQTLPLFQLRRCNALWSEAHWAAAAMLRYRVSARFSSRRVHTEGTPISPVSVPFLLTKHPAGREIPRGTAKHQPQTARQLAARLRSAGCDRRSRRRSTDRRGLKVSSPGIRRDRGRPAARRCRTAACVVVFAHLFRSDTGRACCASNSST